MSVIMFESTLAWHIAQPRSRTANTACSNFTAGCCVGVGVGRVLLVPLNPVSEHAVSRSNKTGMVPVAGPPKRVCGFRSLKSIRSYRFHGLSLEEYRKREGILGVYGVESRGEIFEFIQDDLPEFQLWKHLILK